MNGILDFSMEGIITPFTFLFTYPLPIVYLSLYLPFTFPFTLSLLIGSRKAFLGEINFTLQCLPQRSLKTGTQQAHRESKEKEEGGRVDGSRRLTPMHFNKNLYQLRTILVFSR
jgi:hypothetical protein